MATPSVTLRTIKNVDTGIDISVPRFQEEEAPLGGISILYEISVLTRLNLFKTRLHKSDDVVHFTIFKAYREVEDLFNKLNKKYPKASLPPVPKSNSATKYTYEGKVDALDKFMGAIAKNIQICHSSIFTQFIGIHSHRPTSFSLPNSESSNNCNISNEATLPTGTVMEATSDAPEIFPKMKNMPAEKKTTVPLQAKNVDLFDEVKLTGATTTANNGSKGISQGLFDEFEDDSLFSSKPPEKSIPVVEEKPKISEMSVAIPETPKRKAKQLPLEEFDDSQILIKDRSFGDVTLFKMQESNDCITDKEEYHILVESLQEKSTKNDLLFPGDEILSPDTDNSVNENLDDLLNLEPLPNPSIVNLKSEIEVTNDTAANADESPPKPVPLPRRKSLGKTEIDSAPIPDVMPRKVFLTKTNVPSNLDTANRPPVPAKPRKPSPSIPAKPLVAPKPKPPPKKPKPSVQQKSTTEIDLDIANANKTENGNTVSGLANDLKELDILKYIEQEEKSLDAQLGLFD